MRKRQMPDEMERHFELIAEHWAYRPGQVLLWIWMGLELLRHWRTGQHSAAPFILFGLIDLARGIALLACRSKTGDEEARKELWKTILMIVVLILFLVWLVGSLLTLPVSHGK